MRRATVPVTSFVIGSNRVIGRKRLESFGRGAIAPSFRMEGDKPMKISPVSSSIQVLTSSDALERCSRVIPIIPPVLELGMSINAL